MRSVFFLLGMVATAALVGCAGPEQKFGRGVNNLTEIIRGSEMRRSLEQTMMWDGPSQAPAGFAHGVTRTVTRTGVGLYELVTAPFPPYHPVLVPQSRLYPDASMRWRKYPWGGVELSEYPVHSDNEIMVLRSGRLFETDSSVGFSSGTVAPWIPGNKFSPLGN
jgi:putative exosortase-associated protein (TIGR04073 family)